LGQFDGPDTNACTSQRVTSTTPLQALYLMNNPFVHEQARAFAARLRGEMSDDDGRVERAYLLAFGRPPTPEERAAGVSYLAQACSRLAAVGVPTDQQPTLVWESYVRALFLSNEFVYVD